VQTFQPLADGKGRTLTIEAPGGSPLGATTDRRALGESSVCTVA
jgi:hypothetical protein